MEIKYYWRNNGWYYDEINEHFKLQTQHVLVATSSESDELSANMDNYTSVANNKMLYHTADVTVEEKSESLIISPIGSNVEAQTKIKYKKIQKEINCLQRQECKEKSFLKKMKLLWMFKLNFYNKDSTK